MLTLKHENNLLSKLTEYGDDLSLEERIDILDELINEIEDFDNDRENEANINNWLLISSGFSALLTWSLAYTVPVVGAPLAIASTLGSGAVGISKFRLEAETKPYLEYLERVTVALRTSGATLEDWAAVWAMCGNNVFLNVLRHIASGKVLTTAKGRTLKRSDKNDPMTAAYAYLQSTGIDINSAVAKAREINASRGTPTVLQTPLPQPQQPTILQQSLPVSEQPTVIQAAAPTVIQQPQPPTEQIPTELSTEQLMAMPKQERGMAVIEI